MMNSKYYNKNSKLANSIHGGNLSNDLFVEIDFLDYDYLVLLGGGNSESAQLNFGKEQIIKSKYLWVKDKYSVKHTWAFSLPQTIRRKDILKEMVRLKDKEHGFEDSFFHTYYWEDHKEGIEQDKSWEELRELQQQLITFREEEPKSTQAEKAMKAMEAIAKVYVKHRKGNSSLLRDAITYQEVAKVLEDYYEDKT